MPLRSTLFLPALSLTLMAQAPSPAPVQPIHAAQRKAVIAALAQNLASRYVFPEVAAKVSRALEAKEASGGYASDTSAPAFAQALSKDLRDLSQDLHFRVGYDPGFKPEPDDEDRAPTADELAHLRQEMASYAYGVEKVERLPGNVGYLNLRGFGPTSIVGPAYTSALSLLAGTKALILDLRQNGGGEPESVAYLLSHFFPEGDVRHLNDIYTRPKDRTRQYWTTTVGVHYSGPVYVLISPRTFSGGEECAYDFQTQKRATVVGEVSGGGANPGGDSALGQGFMVFIPTGRAINPITHTNWEHVGVKPDLPVPAADALKAAWAAVVQGELKAAKDPDEKADLADLLGRIQRDDLRKPVYSRPKGL